MMELLERDSFLHELDLMLKEALAGQGRAALVSGEAGIGKTSLVEYFTQAHQDSVRVLWGTCDFLFTPRPLGPLHDMAMQLEGELPVLLNSNTDRQAIFSACLTELQKNPTILVFEDVHWADEATLDLIKFLGRRIQHTSSLFILTYRDDELSPEHPLRFVLGDLPRGPTKRLHLLPLSETSVLALASAENQTERANELFDATGGNPFFVTEALASKGTGVPSTVRDAVLARAARLSPSARALLEAAAVIGSRVEPWLLSKIVGAESVYVEECISKGMLQVQGDYYAFRHELARQTILESISPQRKIALHHMTLNALKESLETRNDLARLANHAEGTKDADAVLEYTPAAARQASAASSHREAIELYGLALRFADSLPPVRHAQMLEAYSEELRFANRAADIVISLKKAAELWHLIGNRLKESANLDSLTEAFFMLGRNTELEETSQAAITALEGLPPSIELARAYRGMCFVRMIHRDCAEAVDWGEKAIALAERFEDFETLARAYNFAGCAALVMDYERGLSLMERSLAIGREANLPWAFPATLNNLGWMLAEVYRLADADLYLTEGIPYAAEHDDDYHLLQMLTWRALVRLYQGHWGEAIEISLKVLQSRYVDIESRTCALLALARTRIRLGDPEALVALDEAFALSVQAAAIPRLGPARVARAEMAWLAGNNDHAIEEARAVYDMAVNKKHPWIAGELAFWRWRAGDDFTPPLWIATPFALQIAGDWRGAAEEWEQRGCPYERALALMDGDEAAQLAALEIFEHLGAQPAIVKLKEKMRAQGMRGIPRGPRLATRENPFGLTARELEVVGLIAEGKSNREIAKIMTVGVRTVETYVTRILNKFGFDSRVQIAAWAIEHGLFSPIKDN